MMILLGPLCFLAQVQVIACVGDSITEGVGAAQGKAYPSQLQAILGASYDVQNFGVSARTLLKKGDYPYWRENAFQRAKESQPKAVIIMLGTNDTKPQNWRFASEFEADYRELIQSFKRLPSSPKVFICRPCPVPEPGNFGINEANIQKEIPVVDRLAKSEQIGVIDMHAALAGHPEMLPDRVHPNTEGARLMAEAAAKVIQKAVPASE